MPAGNGGAGWGAKGFAGAWLAGLAAGDGDDVCAGVWAAKPKHKAMAAISKRKATVFTRFMVSPLRFFVQHVLHNPDFSTLAAVYIGGEIEQYSILAGAGGVKQIFHHNQCAAVVLNHARQKQTVKIVSL